MDSAFNSIVNNINKIDSVIDNIGSNSNVLKNRKDIIAARDNLLMRTDALLQSQREKTQFFTHLIASNIIKITVIIIILILLFLFRSYLKTKISRIIKNSKIF